MTARADQRVPRRDNGRIRRDDGSRRPDERSPRVRRATSQRTGDPVRRADTGTGRGLRQPIRSQIDPVVVERRRQVRSEQRMRRRRWSVVVGSVIIVIAALFGVALSPLLGVRHVRTSGSSHVDGSHIESLADLTEGAALLRLDLPEIERRIESDPWIANARVRRSYPTTVLIEVTEERPLFVLRTDEGAALVARTGRILEVRTGNRSAVDFSDVGGAALPVVDTKGPIATDVSSDDDLVGRQVSRPITEMMRVIRNLPVLVGQRMTSVDAGDPTSLRLVMDDGSTVLMGPPEDVSAKMAALSAVLVGVDDRCIDGVDVRNPVRVTVTRTQNCILSDG